MSLNIEVGDKIILKSPSYIVEIISDQTGEPYSGSDINNGEEITFYEKDIECIKKHNLKCVGGDRENYWLFYTGSGYSSTKESIANWALYELRDTDFLNMSIEEIMYKHIYWGTDTSNHKAFYNGDTYILFLDVNKLPQDMQSDAKRYLKIGD